MNRLIAPALAVLALIALFALTDQATIEANGFAWETDYKAGLQRAKDEGKPVFLVFR